MSLPSVRIPGAAAPKLALRRLSQCALAPLLAYVGANLACSSGHRPREIGNDPVLYHGAAGSSGQSELDAGGTAGDTGIDEPSPDAGDAGAPAPNLCGNGLLDPGEDCEPGVPFEQTCLDRGFDTGTLSCGVADCRFVTSGCSGVENCYDGRDNDGDGLMDCEDSGDCASSCVDPCAAPPVLSGTTTVQGSTRGRSSVLAASCSNPAPSGPETVYQITVSQDSKLDVNLSSTQLLNLSVRTSCADASTELACAAQTRVTLDAPAGSTYFIVIDGDFATDAGNYVLDVRTRQVVCGDGIRDSNEVCDDGNVASNDGCSSSCAVEPNEGEPNNNRRSADDYDTQPWFARMSSGTDLDYVRVNVPDDGGSIVVRTKDLGDRACPLNLMDTFVDILDTNFNGNQVLASDDDSGEGKCSLAFITGLASGNYYVRVSVPAGASPASFPYRLDIDVGICGDGVLDQAEECDDGNLIDGDDCDSQCVVEGNP